MLISGCGDEQGSVAGNGREGVTDAGQGDPMSQIALIALTVLVVLVVLGYVTIQVR